MSVLEMRNVSFYDNLNPVIDEVSLQIEKGSVTAFLGEPGGGKSTALKLISGIVVPSRGKVFFEDRDISKMSGKENLLFREKTGFMFQNSALWANQSIYQNLELPVKLHHPDYSVRRIDDIIKEIAKLVEFSKPLTLRPAALSAGEQKRIAFARALICNPQILFLDEPTESLDEKTASLFITILKDFVAGGNTLLYVSHDNAFINAFENDKYYFANGTIVDKILLHDQFQEDYDEV
jgi:ABC-type lipoprotein export system ATPase subunit